MNFDSKNNRYREIGNIRITYVRSETRSEEANWSGSDVVRVQAYKGTGRSGGLHRGAEMPVNSPTDLMDMAMILLELARDQITGEGEAEPQ